MKKVICTIMCLIIVASLSACGTPKATPDNTIENDVADIVSDIDLSNCFTSDFVYESDFKHIGSELNKRQTNIDNKEDIVFYDIKIANDYFEIIYTYKLLYNFYDEGGWILDDYSLEDKTITPIKAAEADLILEQWNEKRYYVNHTEYTLDGYKEFYGSFNDHSAEMGESICVLDAEKAHTILTLDVSCSLSHATGNITLDFDKENGWKFSESSDDKYSDLVPYLSVTDLECDYSIAEGDFSYTNGDTEYTLSITIDEKNGVVNAIYRGSETTYDFDPICGIFAAFEYYSEYSDAWVGRSTTYYRIK
ncbi:MAG: hypothetical protein IJD19_06335 [Ruminococcus sp.]|nr:hypothetical protein [Ruminococcus sp.]